MRKSSVILIIALGTILLLAAAISLYSCSSSGGGNGANGGGGAAAGTVALYATDDMSDHKQVIATINDVTVLSSSSGTTCDVLTTPTTFNIANLASVLQLLNVVSCPAATYDTLHIDFNKTVTLMDKHGVQSSCSFTSYIDDSNQTNALQCVGDNCSLDVNGAINILVSQYSQVALDFDLKKFKVEHFGTPQCTVTMKVSPIHGEEFRKLGYHEGVTGLVSNLTTTSQTFDITKHDMSFHVLYSGISSTQQPGLDDLLLRAGQDGLRTKVTSTTIDYVNNAITASAIIVKVDGLVSGLTTSTQTFTLTYKTGKTMNVDYSKATVEGILANDVRAGLKLYGFDSTRLDFLASKVEVDNESYESDDEGSEMDRED